MPMAAPKLTHSDLPRRMVRRVRANKRGLVREYFFYEHPRDSAGKRKLTPLGSDLTQAKLKWAELEGKPRAEAPLAADEKSLAGIHALHLKWAEDRSKSRLSPRTLEDRAKYWKKLAPVFGAVPIDALQPAHMLQYFDKRSSQVSGKKELKYLSVVCNWARARGYMTAPNPLAGILRQMKVNEGRDIYVSDADLARVYKHAGPIVRDVLDLAYLTGQRPADARRMRWDQVRDGAIEIQQGKTGAKLRIEVAGELAALLERIRARGVVGMTILADPKGQPLKQFGYFRSQFDAARDAAEAEALANKEPFTRFQLRDLRAKTASDSESMASARRLLGHSTEAMTADYVRERRGEIVPALRRKG
jgi:integrase